MDNKELPLESHLELIFLLLAVENILIKTCKWNIRDKLSEIVCLNTVRKEN